MLRRASKVSQILIDEFNTINVRIDLQVLDGEKMIASRVYRFSINSDENPSNKIETINRILANSDEEQIDGSLIIKICEVIK